MGGCGMQRDRRVKPLRLQVSGCRQRDPWCPGHGPETSHLVRINYRKTTLLIQSTYLRVISTLRRAYAHARSRRTFVHSKRRPRLCRAGL